LHRRKVRDLFGFRPNVFRNTELIYNNDLAKVVENLGYSGVLAEGADHVLGWRSPNFLYRPEGASHIKLLLKNYKLSDDVAFRFSSRDWAEWPLTAGKFAQWLNAVNGNGEVINLFMDYETFGEHQWEDTGIFDFLRELPAEFSFQHRGHRKFCCISSVYFKLKSSFEAIRARSIAQWSGTAFPGPRSYCRIYRLI